MMKKLLCVMMFFLFSLSATTVVATSSFYHIGKNLSTRTAQSVWDNLGHNCHEVDYLFKKLLEIPPIVPKVQYVLMPSKDIVLLKILEMGILWV
jgi:hypothetical protein